MSQYEELQLRGVSSLTGSRVTALETDSGERGYLVQLGQPNGSRINLLSTVTELETLRQQIEGQLWQACSVINPTLATECFQRPRLITRFTSPSEQPTKSAMNRCEYPSACKARIVSSRSSCAFFTSPCSLAMSQKRIDHV